MAHFSTLSQRLTLVALVSSKLEPGKQPRRPEHWREAMGRSPRVPNDRQKQCHYSTHLLIKCAAQ